MTLQNPYWRQRLEESNLFIFDVDGTLYSSENILHPAYEQAIKKFNQDFNSSLEVPSLNDILLQVGLPAKTIFANLFPQLSVEMRQELNKFSLSALVDMVRNGGGMLYEYVPELLGSLKDRGKKICLASNGRRAYLEAIIKGFSLSEYVEALQTIEDEATPSKADLIHYYCEKYSVEKDNALMLGDRHADLEAARIAGVAFIGVNYGHGHAEEIKSADLIVDGLNQLIL